MPEYRPTADGWLARLASTLRSSRGASLVEYAMLVGLIAAVCIAAMSLLGRATEPAFSRAEDGFTTQN